MSIPIPQYNRTHIPGITVDMLTTTSLTQYQDLNRQLSPDVRANLTRLINEVLQPITLLIGELPTISSGYRCPQLNVAVGGSKTSQHTDGGAVDIVFRTTSLLAAFNKIMFSPIPYSQIILEFGRWIHVGLIDQERHPGLVSQRLIASKVAGKTIYTPV